MTKQNEEIEVSAGESVVASADPADPADPTVSATAGTDAAVNPEPKSKKRTGKKPAQPEVKPESAPAPAPEVNPLHVWVYNHAAIWRYEIASRTRLAPMQKTLIRCATEMQKRLVLSNLEQLSAIGGYLEVLDHE